MASKENVGTAVTARDELDAIMQDMDAAYAAIREAGYPPLDGPEHRALDAVYTRLRAWNGAQR